MKKTLFFLLAIGISAASALGAPKAINLLNVSYDPTRELYRDYNALFAKWWPSQSGGSRFQSNCPTVVRVNRAAL